ncbi:histidine triad nucleotide-binding protein [Exilibacterium tricleocarpae]|uniref:Histidine triad nucleotide-binding protein n=1 Tax=Exilibacterium tricleocarpae TaxID=2591008 RepID=A0A545U6Y3_9GAMM|nr:histidine triad nucleotide-binding protein [Exilibacterium tricleocarpae]TQV85238.1 histidine triad nucleotide-binding protein [Exilibacterium tricleocarpae]
MTEASAPEPSIFTRIINGDIPADILYEDDDCICIRDIAPKAPTHLLIIPRQPIPRLADAGAADQALLGHLLLKVGDIARQVGVEEAFRVVINNGTGAGQTVFHLHLHLLAGKAFAENDLGF